MALSLNYRSYCHELEVELQVQIDFHAKLQECLEQKIFKQYSATTSHGNLKMAAKSFFKEEMNAQFIVKLASKKRNVFEEILILDVIGLVGSLGGSLGLFVGFSFFGYATPIIDAVFDKVASFF